MLMTDVAVDCIHAPEKPAAETTDEFTNDGYRTLDFGKHKDKQRIWVAENDRAYCCWAKRQAKGFMHVPLKAFLDWYETWEKHNLQSRNEEIVHSVKHYNKNDIININKEVKVKVKSTPTEASGHSIFNMGKHKGRSFGFVAVTDRMYCAWARRQDAPCETLKLFVDFLDKFESMSPAASASSAETKECSKGSPERKRKGKVATVETTKRKKQEDVQTEILIEDDKDDIVDVTANSNNNQLALEELQYLFAMEDPTLSATSSSSSSSFNHAQLNLDLILHLCSQCQESLTDGTVLSPSCIHCSQTVHARCDAVLLADDFRYSCPSCRMQHNFL